MSFENWRRFFLLISLFEGKQKALSFECLSNISLILWMDIGHSLKEVKNRRDCWDTAGFLWLNNLKESSISPYQRHKLSWWMVKLTQKINKWKQPQEVEIWENFTSLWLERGSLQLRCKISMLQVLQCWKTVLKFHQQMALSFYNKFLWSWQCKL